MLDIETMGTAPGSAIVAIGAVEFNQEKILREFYYRIHLASSVQCGLSMDPNTVLWWLEQSDEGRMQVASAFALATLPKALQLFSEFCSEGVEELWGNGSDFDNVLLSCAYDKIQMQRPWTHKANRCYRTLKNLFPFVALPYRGVQHHALDDARNQANHLIQIFQSKLGSPSTP